MTELITVHAEPGKVRISRVTPHGEEIIEPNAIVTALAVMLWERLASEPLGGYVDRSPDFVAQAIQQAVGDLAAPLIDAHDEDRQAIKNLSSRVDGLNEALAALAQSTSNQVALAVLARPNLVVNPRGV
jgi:hypothetical protein